MQTDTLKEYLVAQKYADAVENISIELLGGGKSQNHLNYKVITPKETFVARVTKPGDILSYANLSDEYVILKLVESQNIGPRAKLVDLEGFDTPLLLEEYFAGTLFADLERPSQEVFDRAIDLIVRTSKVRISQDEFPFKYAYTTYQSNFRSWDIRIKEIDERIDNPQTVKELSLVADKARAVLGAKDELLRAARPEFIYNDVHPGNVFLLDSGEVRFIDWQKVSLGDPSFMLALFAKRFGEIWNLNNDTFTKKALNAYTAKKKLPINFKNLLSARMLERTVSDAIWVVWAAARRGASSVSTEDNSHLQEAKDLLVS